MVVGRYGRRGDHVVSRVAVGPNAEYVRVPTRDLNMAAGIAMEVHLAPKNVIQIDVTQE